MVRCLRTAGLILALGACATVNAAAQDRPPLVFTAASPDRTSPDTALQASAVVEERGLALWSGTASDFGVGVTLSTSGWAVRSIASMVALPFDKHERLTFQQLEIVRPIFSTGSASVAGGGGIRQEWDGTRVLIGRVLAAADMGGGRIQGSLVLERVAVSPLKHDAADVVTSVGWSRRVGDRAGVGIEGIGQDLEGFWNPAEADGGAKLLIGPSLHLRSKRGDWDASLTAGPVVHTPSTTRPSDLAGAPPGTGRHFGLFASASWLPPRR
jgi:hypothetical protein